MALSPSPGRLCARLAMQTRSVRGVALTDARFIRTARLAPIVCRIACVTTGTTEPLLTANIACLVIIAKVANPLRAQLTLHLQPEPRWRRRASAIVDTMVFQMSPALHVRRGRGVGPV